MPSARNEVKAEGTSRSCAISPLLSFSIAGRETIFNDQPGVEGSEENAA